MATVTKDFEREATKVARALDRKGISKAETGRLLGLSGNSARGRVSKVLNGREVSWPLLERIRTEVLGIDAIERERSEPTAASLGGQS